MTAFRIKRIQKGKYKEYQKGDPIEPDAPDEQSWGPDHPEWKAEEKHFVCPECGLILPNKKAFDRHRVATGYDMRYQIAKEEGVHPAEKSTFMQAARRKHEQENDARENAAIRIYKKRKK